MNEPSILLPACANWTPGASACKRQGRKACGNCKLVVYCGADCQKEDWVEHKKFRRFPMSKESWHPAWDRQRREPAWASGTASMNLHNPFGGNKFLWGNTPALDVLKLEHNEGFGYRDVISLLFAASGDLRHIVKTVADLPDGMTQQINITMNDREFHVVARNTVLLLLALTMQEPNDIEKTITPLDIAEALIHVWYSVLIPSNVLSQLQDRVKPLLMEVCYKISGKPSTATLGKTWEFTNGRTLRLVLKQEDWLRLGEFLGVPKDMSVEDALKIRRAVKLAPERLDYRDRWYFKDVSPSMRIANQQFREDGLLLPFGHPRTAFDQLNPTFFLDSKGWPFGDKANPSNGWPILDIQQTPSPAPQDWYGKTFMYLHNTLKIFLSRLGENRISLVLYNVDVKELPKYHENNKFSRREVANVCDVAYLGTRGSLSLLSPLLQSPLHNPHATFITLFINAVQEALKMGDQSEEIPNMSFLTKYLPFPPTPSINDADMTRIWDARHLALDVNKYFERYMKVFDFERIPADLRIEVKKSNTVAEKWPTQLKLEQGTKAAEEEFRLNLGSNFTNIERYVEWRRLE